MRALLSIILLAGLTVPLTSFCDFIPFWTVKLNGKVIYDSRNDTSKVESKLYPILTKDIAQSDTLEVEYFMDTPCTSCIYSYFISEYEKAEDEGFYKATGVILNERKYLGPRAYKSSLLDILNCGSKSNVKAIAFYLQGESIVHQLFFISFR